MNKFIDWSSVIPALCPLLREAVYAEGTHVPCPWHGGKDGMRRFNDFLETGGMICNTCGPFPNGYLVISRHLGISTRKAAKLVNGCQSILDNDFCTGAACSQPEAAVKPNFGVTEDIKSIIESSYPLDHPKAKPARRYLDGRSLKVPELLENLRYFECSNYAKNGGPVRPALVAPIEKAGKVVGLHRTFITNSGAKAAVKNPKIIFPVLHKGATTGGAVQLFSATDHLAVSEGIETALAINELTGWPVWAALSANGLKNFQVPASIKTLYVYADNDLSGVGQQAAKSLCKRVKHGIELVELKIPEMPKGYTGKSYDMLDYLADRRAQND